MDATRRSLIDRLAAAADRMSVKMRRSVIQESVQDWSDIDLTMPQLRTLSFLAHMPRRMGEVAAYLGSSVSSATSLVERLEGKALVERVHDPVDRRVVMCYLAPAGQELVERFWRLQRVQIEKVADILDADELPQVVTSMEILAAAFERWAQAANAKAEATGCDANATGVSPTSAADGATADES